MNTVKSILAVTAISIALFGCGNKTAENVTPEPEAVQEEENHHANDADVSESLERNNGEKWVVNEEMKPFVSKAEKVLETYTASNGTDHQQLAKELQDLNSGLVKSCTMTGKSHEELHKWLHPHLELVAALEKETDATKSKQTVAQLQDSYQQYHQFFQ